MKFGKNLLRVVELSDPEWGPYWMNYKFLKKKINEIVQQKNNESIQLGDGNTSTDSNSKNIADSKPEVEFFRLLRKELKKTSDFYSSAEDIYKIREKRVWAGYNMLKEEDKKHDKENWTRFLVATLKFYKDVLLLENFAIMSYCAFSKILKKHDKLTGYYTRDAFMRNVMSQQNFTNYTYIMDLVKRSEKLFEEVQNLENLKCQVPNDEEKLFIDAIRDLNQHAQEMLSEEKTDSNCNDDDDDEDNDNVDSNNNASIIDLNTSLKNATKASSLSSTGPNIKNVCSWIQSLSDKTNDDSDLSDNSKSKKQKIA